MSMRSVHLANATSLLADLTAGYCVATEIQIQSYRKYRDRYLHT